MKSIVGFVLNQSNRNTKTRNRNDPSARDEDDGVVVDPFNMVANQFKFGRRLCESDELLTKRILLSKNGKKVFYLKRDFVTKADQLMSV